jgi:hypothetical protein
MGSVQPPSAGMQLPATWQVPLAAQTTAVPTQVPALHRSLVVQRVPSSQEVLSAIEAQVPSTAAPSAMEQAWQSLVAPPPQVVSQQTASTQWPLPQLESAVQALPWPRRTTIETD